MSKLTITELTSSSYDKTIIYDDFFDFLQV